jgi:hypothetical protein
MSKAEGVKKYFTAIKPATGSRRMVQKRVVISTQTLMLEELFQSL